MIQVEQILARSSPVVIGSFALDTTFCHIVQQRPQWGHARTTADADDLTLRLFTQHKDAVWSFHLQLLTNRETTIQEARKQTPREDLNDKFKVVVVTRSVSHRIGSILFSAWDTDRHILAGIEPQLLRRFQRLERQASDIVG